MAEVLDHPVRVMLASLLHERPASAAELAGKTDLPPEKIRHHLRILRGAGLIELVKEEQRRGMAERYYSAEKPVIFDGKDFADLTVEQKRQINAGVMRISFTEAARAFVAGSKHGRPDACLIREQLRVDEQGWNELVRIEREAWDKVVSLKAAVGHRLNRGRAGSFKATSIIICFEQKLGDGT